MSPDLPVKPKSFSVRMSLARESDNHTKLPAKDWPHAPVHRLSENGIYFLTAGTLYKRKLFDTADKRDLLERLLLSLAKEHKWQLEAWAVLANHYHCVARGNPDSTAFGDFLRGLHSKSA